MMNYNIKLMSKLKHITVNQEVYQKLKDLGKAGDSFNDVIIKILEKIPGVYKIEFEEHKEGEVKV